MHSELSAPGFVVIVLDNDLAVRNSLKFSLEIEGFTVRSYATAAELLDAGDPAPCGCLVVDQHMPGMTGLDLIELLRRRHVSAPAILITGDPSLTLRERARKASVPIVEKPLLGGALLQKIRDVTGDGWSKPGMCSKLLFWFLFAVLTTGSTALPSALAQESGASVKRGETLLTRDCARCHATGSAGLSPHPEAPPFRTLSRRYPIEGLGEALAEGLFVGHPDMPQFTFEARDVGAIIAYLKSIQEN